MKGVISIKRSFMVLFIMASLISIVVIDALYFHATSQSVQTRILFQIPNTGKQLNLVQVVSKEVVLPLTGEYSVKMRGRANLYIQTNSKLYRNPEEITVDEVRIIRIILLNQSSDVCIELQHKRAPDYKLPLLLVITGGVMGLAVRMFKFE